MGTKLSTSRRSLHCERVYIHMSLLASYVASCVMFVLTSSLSINSDVITASPVLYCTLQV